MCPNNEIDNNIRPYLDEIAARLWSGHAAVMVGAGFSKNADDQFPDWPQLGDIFYKKIHGREPTQRYLNVLKLADEVEAAFGRPVLKGLLRSSIPDKNCEPSPLHVKLLDLPWTDVFTTNYDTLLERACSLVTSQKYDVIVNKEDLVFSERPRIIKLHGSFSSSVRDFVITEEDYRLYPKNFAPFVNTVQQSLLENTLCLIGFSGDDPNFLQWIGWIRDNLGRHALLKIYLVGVFDISDAQRKLFDQRDIVLVNLAGCQGVENDHYKVLHWFCEELRSRKAETNRLEWATGSRMLSFDREHSNKTEQIQKLVSEWRSFRLLYPGWCILPEDRRGYLWIFTQWWLAEVALVKSDLPLPLDLTFAYELNWRLERCLYPIWNSVGDWFEELLLQYWPFSSEDEKRAAQINPDNPKYQQLPWVEIKSMWLHLSLSVLRLYREEGMDEKWQATNKKLESLSQYLSPEEKAFLSYERTLHSLFALDLPEIKKQLSAWVSNESLPFWEAKRAGILVEIGQIEDAEKILEQSLQNIRSRLNLKPVTTDYSLVSQEAFVMLSLRYVKFAIALRKRSLPQDQQNMERQFTERWNILKQYKCDPDGELDLFESRLKQMPIEQSAHTEKKHLILVQSAVRIIADVGIKRLF